MVANEKSSQFVLHLSRRLYRLSAKKKIFRKKKPFITNYDFPLCINNETANQERAWC
jgi:hypothetical protein